MKTILSRGLWVVLLLALALGGRWLVVGGGDSPLVTSPAVIGGPFALVDHHGKAVTDQDYRGKLMLIYFGYTFCPDACPTELGVMSGALDKLGAQATEIAPLFITVDPERDSPATLATYLTNFHPALIGLSGTGDQVKSAIRAYRVYAKKAEVQGDGSYLMDHSTLVYLMGRDGHFLASFQPTVTAEQMAVTLRKHL